MYKQAQQVTLIYHVGLSAKVYWNLLQTSKLSPKDKIQVTSDTLESKGFHIQWFKKYWVERNIRQRQVIGTFFFCSPEQIEIAQRFINSFPK